MDAEPTGLHVLRTMAMGKQWPLLIAVAEGRDQNFKDPRQRLEAVQLLIRSQQSLSENPRGLRITMPDGSVANVALDDPELKRFADWLKSAIKGAPSKRVNPPT